MTERRYCPKCHDRANALTEEGGRVLYECSNIHVVPKGDLLTPEEANSSGSLRGKLKERFSL